VPRFMKDEFLEDFGTWDEHVSSWQATRQNKAGFVLLRFEDMLADAGRELGRMARLLRVSAAPEAVAWAVELSSAEQMRRLEDAGAVLLTKESRQDKPFVRTASSSCHRGQSSGSKANGETSCEVWVRNWAALRTRRQRSRRWRLVNAVPYC
jgi:hypothetical protein